MRLVVAALAAAVLGPAEVRDAVTAAGFPELAGRAAHAARPVVRVGRVRLDREPGRLGTSRLGGDPDLPRDAAWPACRGRPQSFLMQLRVRDLPGAAAPLRRAGGRLLVFTEVRFEPGERHYGLWAGRCTAVLHAPAGTPLRRTAPPGKTMRLRPAALRYRVGTDLPDSYDRRLAAPMDDVVLDDVDRWEAWWELRRRLQGETRADAFDQSEHKLLGYLEGPNGESGRCWRRAGRRARPWRHLLTVGPDFRTRFEVADAGRLQVAISRADLRRGRFDRVCGIFDSG